MVAVGSQKTESRNQKVSRPAPAVNAKLRCQNRAQSPFLASEFWFLASDP